MATGAQIIASFCGALAMALPCLAEHESDADLSGYIFRGLKIANEPSIRAKCDDSEYAAFRVFKYDVAPIGIVRIELTGASPRMTIRSFGTKSNPESVERNLTLDEWKSVIRTLQASGFWSAEEEEGAWIPDGLKLLIEGCYAGKFHSLLLYPERDFRMHDVVAHLASLKN